MNLILFMGPQVLMKIVLIINLSIQDRPHEFKKFYVLVMNTFNMFLNKYRLVTCQVLTIMTVILALLINQVLALLGHAFMVSKWMGIQYFECVVDTTHVLKHVLLYRSQCRSGAKSRNFFSL